MSTLPRYEPWVNHPDLRAEMIEVPDGEFVRFADVERLREDELDMAYMSIDTLKAQVTRLEAELALLNERPQV